MDANINTGSLAAAAGSGGTGMAGVFEQPPLSEEELARLAPKFKQAVEQASDAQKLAQQTRAAAAEQQRQLDNKYADLAKPAQQLGHQNPMGQLGARIDTNDLSTTLMAEASRRIGKAEQELRRWMRVYESMKTGEFRSMTVRDLRALLDPNAP